MTNILDSTDPLFVAPHKTIFTEIDLADSILNAYKRLFLHNISFDTLAVLWAHFALECGRGKECFNWNAGNVKRIKGHEWTWYRCSEIIKDARGNSKEVFFDPPNSQTHFCSYQNLNEAILEHLEFLNTEKYQKAFQAALAGDPALYSHELKIAGYYTASETLYAKTILSLDKEFIRLHSEFRDKLIELSNVAESATEPSQKYCEEELRLAGRLIQLSKDLESGKDSDVSIIEKYNV